MNDNEKMLLDSILSNAVIPVTSINIFISMTEKLKLLIESNSEEDE